MFQFLKHLASKKWVPVCWTFTTIILLCLPGSAFPDGGLFHIPHLDKLIHIVLFGGIVWWWVLYLDSRQSNRLVPTHRIGRLVLSSIFLGVALEFIQLNFIPNRDFDAGDIVANAAGSLLAGVSAHFSPSWRSR